MRKQAIYVNMSTHSNNESLDESYSPDSSGNDETSSEELEEYPDTSYVPYDSDVEPLATKEQAAAFKEDQRRESELERELNSRLAKEKDTKSW